MAAWASTQTTLPGSSCSPSRETGVDTATARNVGPQADADPKAELGPDVNALLLQRVL